MTKKIRMYQKLFQLKKYLRKLLAQLIPVANWEGIEEAGLILNEETNIICPQILI